MIDTLSHSDPPTGAGMTNATASLKKEHTARAAGIPEAIFIVMPTCCAASIYIHSIQRWQRNVCARLLSQQKSFTLSIAVIQNIAIFYLVIIQSPISQGLFSELFCKIKAYGCASGLR